MNISDIHSRAYAVSATVAGELHSLTKIAQQVAIIAKNARALAIRAGESVAGFRAITGFIEEISFFSVQRGDAIDQLATTVSRISVDNMRMKDAIDKYNLVYKSQAKYANSLRRTLLKIEDETDEIARDFRRSIRRLKMEVDEIGGQLRGMQLMVTSSRVEASGAGNFRDGLDSVADQLNSAYETMYLHISKARSLIQQIQLEAA